MAAKLLRKIDIGLGIGGYQFEVVEDASHDRKLYDAGLKFESKYASEREKEEDPKA
jgi:hypothetical protein